MRDCKEEEEEEKSRRKKTKKRKRKGGGRGRKWNIHLDIFNRFFSAVINCHRHGSSYRWLHKRKGETNY